MKTITEFAAITLKNAAKTRQDLTAGGKTAEELPAALGEALKLEGDKLTHLLAALDAAGDKHNDLKRVIVHSTAEGEAAPSGAKKIGEHFYTVEYFTSAKSAPSRDDARGGRGDKRGGGRGGKPGERGGKPGERGGRGGERGAGGGRPPRDGASFGDRPRAPRPAGAPSSGGIPKPLAKPIGPPVVFKTPESVAAPAASAPASTESQDPAQDSGQTPAT
jgi:hypothetical protein